MKRQTPYRMAYPFGAHLAWASLGLKWMEMMAASAPVIARLSTRTNTPVQWFTMGSEKVEAALQSSAAMTRQMMRILPFGPPAAWSALPTLLSVGVAPYRARAVRNARR